MREDVDELREDLEKRIAAIEELHMITWRDVLAGLKALWWILGWIRKRCH